MSCFQELGVLGHAPALVAGDSRQRRLVRDAKEHVSDGDFFTEPM